MKKNINPFIKVTVLAFIIFNLMIVYCYTCLPLINYLRSQKWVQTSCTVITSNSETRRDRFEMLLFMRQKYYHHRVNIKYMYFFNNQKFIGDLYNFVPLLSSGNTSDNIINLITKLYTTTPISSGPLMADKNVNCYVNPNNPKESVINRNISFDYFRSLHSILILIFITLLYKTKKKRTSKVENKLNSNNIENVVDDFYNYESTHLLSKDLRPRPLFSRFRMNGKQLISIWYILILSLLFMLFVAWLDY